MFPLLAPLITGGASLLGSMFSSDTSAQNTQAQIAAQESMQNQSEQFNASQAQQNRDFQQQMSSTAYQRSSADMTAAGLNPMMMFGSGGPSSVPSGSTASIGTPTAPMSQAKGALSGIGEAVKQGFSTAVQTKEMDVLTDRAAQLEIDNEIQKRKAAAGGPEAEVEATKAGAAKKRQDIDIDIPEQARGTGYTWLPDYVKSADVWSKYGGDILRRGTGAIGDILGLGNKAGAMLGSSAKAADRFPGGFGSNYGGPSPSRWQFEKDSSGVDSFSDRFNSAYGNTQ